MRCVYTDNFANDLRLLHGSPVASRISRITDEVEAADRLAAIRNVKAIKGRHGFYRIRAGAYRVGIFISKGTVYFMCCLPRSKVYRNFPP